VGFLYKMQNLIKGGLFVEEVTVAMVQERLRAVVGVA